MEWYFFQQNILIDNVYFFKYSKKMLIRLMCIFSIFTFVSTSFVEVQEPIVDHHVSGKNTSVETLKNKVHSIAFLESSDCEDCRDNGCSDTDNCCQRLCSCSSSFFIESKKNLSNTSSLLTSKIEWYFYSNYRSPFHDPALKPPLFS